MSRNQGRIAAYLWSHGGIAVRPKGIGGKMHVELRGKTAIAGLFSWVVLGALIIEASCRAL